MLTLAFGTTLRLASVTTPVRLVRAIRVAALEDRSSTMNDQTTAGAGGPEAPPEPARADPIAGELVTETFEYDGGRQVTVYVPPDPPEAVVFAADGQRISQWGGYLEAADVPSTMIVGVHGLADEMPRLRSTHRSLTRNGSRHTRGFSSWTSAGGRGRGSEWTCPPNAPRCSVSRRVVSSRSPLGFGIRTSTVRSSPARRAGVTSRLA